MYTNELNTALKAVVSACRLCEAVRESLVNEETVAKKDRSPVTVADFGAQAIVNCALHQAFPNDPIMGEEDSRLLRDTANRDVREKVAAHVRAECPGLGDEDILSAIDRGCHPGGPEGRFWTLDPIDGTKGYIRGDQYAVALALIDKGKVVLGVLGCPHLPAQAVGDHDGPRGVILAACRDGDAFQETIETGRRRLLRVSEREDPALAVFCESVESGHTAHGAAAEIMQRLGVTAEPVRIDSQCKYAIVARGEADVYLRMPTRADYEERIWDHAAGVLIVTEAGGRVTDIRGKALDFSRGTTLRNNSGVTVTNGLLHDRLIATIKQQP